MASGAFMAAGLGFSMVSAYKQAQAQKAMMRYQAKVSANNAQVAEDQAQQEGVVGAQMEQASRLRTAQMFGSQRASMAANGIDLGEGVATDILTSTRAMGEQDALTIRDNTARRQWAMRVQGQNYIDESGASNASASVISPGMSAVGSLLGNASAVASIYKNYKGS